MNIKKLLNSKKFKYGSVALALSIVLVAGIILGNVVVSLINRNGALDFDMTGDSVYTLTSASKLLLDENNTAVKLYFLKERDKASDTTGLQFMVNLVDSYLETYGDKWLEVEYIDLVKNPTFKNNYTKSSSETLLDTSVIVECVENREYKVLTVEDYLLLELDPLSYYYNITGFQGELALTSAMLNVINPDGLTAYFTSNHGEESAVYLTDFLEEVGYDVGTVDLSKNDIPEETSLLIVNNPKYDFIGADLNAGTSSGVSEIEKLVDYLKTPEKNMLVFMSPETPQLKEFEEFLAVYGMSVTRGVITDMSNSAATTNGMMVYGIYSADDGSVAKEIIERMSDSSYKTVFYKAAPINILFDYKENITVSELVTTSKTAYYGEGDERVDGQFNMVTCSTSAIDNGSSNLILCSTNYFNNYLATGSYANRDLMYSIAESFGVVNISTDVQIKTFDDHSLVISETASNVWGILITVVPALIVLVVGAFVWIKRRHL